MASWKGFDVIESEGKLKTNLQLGKRAICWNQNCIPITDTHRKNPNYCSQPPKLVLASTSSLKLSTTSSVRRLIWGCETKKNKNTTWRTFDAGTTRKNKRRSAPPKTRRRATNCEHVHAHRTCLYSGHVGSNRFCQFTLNLRCGRHRQAANNALPRAANSEDLCMAEPAAIVLPRRCHPWNHGSLVRRPHGSTPSRPWPKPRPRRTHLCVRYSHPAVSCF